jgi:hypothetical protein
LREPGVHVVDVAHICLQAAIQSGFVGMRDSPVQFAPFVRFSPFDRSRSKARYTNQGIIAPSISEAQDQRPWVPAPPALLGVQQQFALLPAERIPKGW